MQLVRVRAGTLIKLDVDIKGEPPPTKTWSFANKVLEQTLTLRIENEDYNTKMQISDSSWQNSGIYTLRAENSSGFDEATVEVIVLGMYSYENIFYQKMNQFNQFLFHF